MSPSSAATNHRPWAAWLNRLVYRLSRHWLLPISFFIAVFVGLPWLAPLFMELGWKVAWSDRMVFMYTSILLWGVLFWLLRKRLKPLPWWGLVLFLLPMAVDGFTHMISDFTAGIGLGFRDSNAWLALLTNNTFPVTFYAGDALGSFNSWMRLITGLLFSLGIVWTLYPRLHSGFISTASQIEEKLHKAGLEV